MANGLLYLGLRCDPKSARTSNLIGGGNSGAHAITHHGFNFRIEGGAAGAQALAGGRFSQAEIALDNMYGVAPHGYEQNGRVAEHYDPKRRYRARQATECARSNGGVCL
jgi:hypothetical protein